MDTLSIDTAPAILAPAGTTPDPLKRSVAPLVGRDRREDDRILSDPHMLTAQPFCARARMKRPGLDRARHLNLVIALRSELSGWRFPTWQLGSDGKPHPAIATLFAILGTSSWEVFGFLESAHPAFGGGTGIEALMAGRWDIVIAAAELSVSTVS